MSELIVNVINGPNLGRLGRREPAVYGGTTHDELVALIEREAAELDSKPLCGKVIAKPSCWTGFIRPPMRPNP